ncbi:26291_t:CDS:1, partial [Gigaspora margarita]
MKKQRNSYSVEEKQKAMELAHQTSNIYATNYYSLDLTMLGQWVKQFSQSIPSKKSSRSVGSGHRPFFPEEEAQLYEWVKTVQENGLAITYSNLRIKMAEIL